MTNVDALLIAEALAALEVEDVRELKPGSQKAVRIVKKDNVQMVMKVIAIGSSAPDAMKRAEREVELLAGIHSDHVVKVTSELVELGDPVVGAAWLEEHLDGEDLSMRLLKSLWTWDEAARLGLQVASGLSAAHAIGVVHRDLSANNVRCLADGTFKVLDFGFARHTLLSGITVAGQPGTHGYASPEHLHGYSGAPTAASDVFCVGILMYAALASELPIPYRGDEADYATRLSRCVIEPISSKRPDLTPAQAALVMRCLHKQPARRFLNGAALRAALEALA